MPNWHLEGVWFDACKCTIPCPCSFAQPPTFGDCDGVLLWEIRSGNYGQVRLGGLRVAMLGSFVGNVWAEHSDARLAVFIDERAGESQQGALRAIFGGQAGGWPARFAELVGGRVVAVEISPVESSVADDLATWSVRIPGKAEATVEALTGPTSTPGEPVRVHNLPGAEVGPGQGAAVWGRATTDFADALGFSWQRSGFSSKLIPFDWYGPDGA
ncbi:DUF1326 domain-containing protein [Saccharopolyspora taberi]|uniref:DUF1326 domain-containing protein n=1 Tax=Saccharopolyspora taberi TaxID=60895 RepID=UPI0031D2870F